VLDVILGPPGRIAQDFVGLRNPPELLGVSGGLVVRMKALRQDAEQTMNGFRIRVDADLKCLVIIDWGVRRKRSPWRTANEGLIR